MRFFFLWGYIKDRVSAPPPPNDLPELRYRVREAIPLSKMWEESEFRLDACLITKIHGTFVIKTSLNYLQYDV